MPIYSNSQGNQSLDFSGVGRIDFAPISNLGNNVAISTIQDVVAPGADCKVVRVEVAYTGTLSGTVSFNVITGAGNGSTLTVGTVDTNSPTATAVFAANQTIAGSLAGQTTSYYPTVWDAIYPANNPSIPITGYPFTLRFVTNGSGAISGITRVTLVVQYLNQHGHETGMPTPLGNYYYDPSTF